MNSLKLSFIGILVLLISGCEVAPKPIKYGVDNCHYCKMTVVDKIHAAEIVTKKGKIYTFDSAECMIHFLKDFDTSEVKFYLSNAFSEPEKLIDATEATYLISQNIPSPMGAFLTAFNTKEKALEIQTKKAGTLYHWNDLVKHIKKYLGLK